MCIFVSIRSLSTAHTPSATSQKKCVDSSWHGSISRYWAGPGRPSKSRFEFLRLQESTWTHGPLTIFYPPTPPGDFCRGRIIRNALWGAPRASQDGGLAPKPTRGEPRIFQSPFLGSVVPKKHGLFPGVIAEGSVAALSPQSRY